MKRGVLIALLVAGCFGAEEPVGSQVTSGVIRRDVPVAIHRKLDLLLVIDSSPRMAAHRANVLANLRRFAEAMERLEGGAPDLHIGVVTTDVGTRGAEDSEPGPAIGSGGGACSSDGDAGELRANGADIAGRFLIDYRQSDGTRLKNYAGDLADTLVAIADRGSAGCALARPLEAVRRAIQHPANDGFLRYDAMLGVVFLTPGDDCSFGRASSLEGSLDCPTGALVPVAEYASFLTSLKSDPGKVIVSGALGADGPVAGAARSQRVPCAGPAEGSDRLHALLDGFANRSSRVSICEHDLGDAFALYTQQIKTSLGAPCFDVALADADLELPGIQYDCAVWYQQRGYDVDVLPACDLRGIRPCYRIERDPQICIDAGHERLRFELGDGFPDEAHLIAECVTR